MKKKSVLALLTATSGSLFHGYSILALSDKGSAFAQNVANPSQKGSLLIWPEITVDPMGNRDTFVEISNDSFSAVHIRCEYVNELKGRLEFDFELSGKQTSSWDVKTQSRDPASGKFAPNPPHWPTTTGPKPPPFPGGSAVRGELVCFAVNDSGKFQIAWNELAGTGIPVKLDARVPTQLKEAYRYNAWAFAARTCLGDATSCTSTGLALDNANVAFGTPGLLPLTGLNAFGNYDACPAYNIQNFMPNGATLGHLTTTENGLQVVSCYQDLRQDYSLHLTKLQFVVWNSVEQSFGMSYQCVDSVNTVLLSSENPNLASPQNFDRATLVTPNARFMVQGVADSQATLECPSTPATENTGLLGVFTSSVPSGTETRQVGSNTSWGGVFPDKALGQVIDDPSGLAGAVWWGP